MVPDLQFYPTWMVMWPLFERPLCSPLPCVQIPYLFPILACAYFLVRVRVRVLFFISNQIEFTLFFKDVFSTQGSFLGRVRVRVLLFFPTQIEFFSEQNFWVNSWSAIRFSKKSIFIQFFKRKDNPKIWSNLFFDFFLEFIFSKNLKFCLFWKIHFHFFFFFHFFSQSEQKILNLDICKLKYTRLNPKSDCANWNTLQMRIRPYGNTLQRAIRLRKWKYTFETKSERKWKYTRNGHPSANGNTLQRAIWLRKWKYTRNLNLTAQMEIH